MFSRYHTDTFKQSKFVSVFHQEETKRPVNYYIQDDNVVTWVNESSIDHLFLCFSSTHNTFLSSLLRIIYSESSKDEILNDNDILEAFFSTVEHGKKVLNDFSDLKWDLILEDTY